MVNDASGADLAEAAPGQQAINMRVRVSAVIVGRVDDLSDVIVESCSHPLPSN